MKTDTITLSLQSPSLVKLLNERRASINVQAVKDAHMHAESGKPQQRDKSSKAITGTYTAQWLDVRAEGFQDIQPEAHATKIRLTIGAINAERIAIKSRISDLEHQHRIAKYKQSSQFIGGLRALNRKGIIAIAALSIAEIGFNAWALQIVGDNLLNASIIALGIALGNGFCARGIVDFLRRREEFGRKTYYFVACLAAIPLTCFIGLSLLRTQALAATSHSVSPLFFFAVNVLLFVAIILVCNRYFPKGNEEAQNAWSAEEETIKLRQKEIDQLHKELKALTATLAEQTNQYLHVTSLANHFNERINSSHRETIELYRHTNLTARKDNMIPESFNEAIPDLPAPLTIPSIELNLSNQ